MNDLDPHAEFRAAFRGILKANGPHIYFRWEYPAEDWPLAVSTGAADLESYQMLLERGRVAAEECERLGVRCIPVKIRVAEMHKILADGGLPSTPENRTQIVTERGLLDLASQ